jgi:hypothetical protein
VGQINRAVITSQVEASRRLDLQISRTGADWLNNRSMGNLNLNQKNRANSNGRGGARPGAGRKPKFVTVKNREITRQLVDRASKGVSPLEVMLMAMAGLWEMAIEARLSKNSDERATAPMLMTLAVRAAKRAAPFCHARLKAVHVSGDRNSLVPVAPVINLTVEKQLPTSGVVVLPAGMSVEQFEKAALEA